MANFYYKAIDSEKRISEGQMSAKTREEVSQILVKKGLSTLVIKETLDKMMIKGSIPQLEKITFCRYLSIMLSTGLSLSEGIDVLRRETKNPLMYKILGDMSYSLEQGQQLSTIFERYPDIFESYFLTLTRAGEVSGKLSEVFKYLESQLRAEYNLNSKVKGALIYPGVIAFAMLGIGLLMFFFVLPQVGRVFLSMNLPLPAITKFMFTAAIALNKQMIPLIIGMVVLGGFVFYLLQNKSVKSALLVLIKPIPFIHNLLQKIDLARFCRIFSTLIKSAVPITDALEISFSSLAMPEFRIFAKKFPDEIKRGKSLSTLVRESRAFPSLVTQMVAAGEKTATLDMTLADLATFYEGEVEEQVGNLTQIIEPVLVLCIGIAVGGMILSIISPIYSVVSNLQQAAGSTSTGSAPVH
jgi:type IV pilus assembly protein PilC